MIGGYDPKVKKSHLYFIDYLGAQVDVPYSAHGYGGMMSITVMDRYYKPGTIVKQKNVNYWTTQIYY